MSSWRRARLRVKVDRFLFVLQATHGGAQPLFLGLQLGDQFALFFDHVHHVPVILPSRLDVPGLFPQEGEGVEHLAALGAAHHALVIIQDDPFMLAEHIAPLDQLERVVGQRLAAGERHDNPRH